ncbi:MAG: monomethylamine:corrinoid methyltransferase [candidate division NC10 bacterium]|nr:monomethylamine:corrinoid methyltransferase [candidate division NC10 bacterium]
MLSLLEIAERSQKGPKMDERAWDMALFRTMTALAKKYDIQYPSERPFVNLDDSLPPRAFEAAVEFLATAGVYCVSTGRVIHFTEEEVRQAAREAPSRVIVGEGRDQRVITQKKVEGTEPLNHCGAHHAPFSEELAPLVVKNFAQIPRADYLEGFNFAAVDGREIFGPPMEAYAAKRELAWMREGVRKAGRPGMAICYYPINTRASTMLAPLDPVAGLRRTDGVILSPLPDIKVETDLLTAAIVYEDYGCFRINHGALALVGGFCGGAEGAVIESVARTLTGCLVYHASFAFPGVQSSRNTTAKTIVARDPNLLWATSVAHQTVNRWSNVICFYPTSGACGPGTRSVLVEHGMIAILCAVNGANVGHGRQHRARMNAAQDPLMKEWVVEVSDAVLRMRLTREKADRILRSLYALVGGKPVERGVEDIRECYDLVNHRPSPEYLRLYLRVKEEFARLGLPLNP